MIELAMDGFFRMDYEPMREWAERALSTARPLGDRPLTAAAVAVLAFAAATSGATPEAEARRSEAAALVADLDDDELALRLDAAANLAGAELYLDRYEEAEAHAERAIAVGRATGQSEFIPLPYSILGQVKLLRGQLADAAELLDNAVEGARLSGNVQALAGNLGNRSFAALAAGDVGIALATAEECVELTQGLDQSLVCAAGVALAAALLETGDPATRRRFPHRVLGGRRASAHPRRLEGQVPRAADPLLARAWPPQRSRTRGRGVRRPRPRRCDSAWRPRWPIVPPPPSSSMPATPTSPPSARSPRRPPRTRSVRPSRRRSHGRSRAAHSPKPGKPSARSAELKHAASELQACGALRYRSAAERELRGLGHRIHRRTRPGKIDATGVEALTERELQVARLVVDRRTNPEIAEALFLSPKTVETHMRNIFRKLDVSSRVEVARTVERADRAAHTI